MGPALQLCGHSPRPAMVLDYSISPRHNHAGRSVSCDRCHLQGGEQTARTRIHGTPCPGKPNDFAEMDDGQKQKHIVSNNSTGHVTAKLHRRKRGAQVAAAAATAAAAVGGGA